LVAAAAGPAISGAEAVSGWSDEGDIRLPGEVYEVRTLGAWRDGNRAGPYRVVTLRGGFDRVQTVVMIQWMEQRLDQQAPSVVAVRRVELLDDLGPITVSAVQATEAPNGLNLSIRVKNIVSGEEGDVRAVAARPGQLTAEYTPMNRR
jgi:hypothetical protein